MPGRGTLFIIIKQVATLLDPLRCLVVVCKADETQSVTACLRLELDHCGSARRKYICKTLLHLFYC